jgi:hypothetical protein
MSERPDFSYKKCNTIEELSQYIKEIVEQKHDYNTSGYAITKALLATEMFMAHALGTTGFQHGYAQMAYLMETRGIKTGFLILDGDKVLYPQYDLRQQFEEWYAEQLKSKEVRELAQQKIKEDDNDSFHAHSDVRKRWEELTLQKSENVK